MLSRLRTVALLMLLAGLSLGVFAARAVRALSPSDLGPGEAHGASTRIEVLVEHYRRDHQLTAQQADRVRQALVEYDRRVRQKLLELRQANAPAFEQMTADAEEKIAEVLAEGR